jgi:catechol 2,3-dioxygenase-like lactoylglutathione lyase family enzyme
VAKKSRTHLTCTTLGVRSLPRSQAFYEALGFEVKFVSKEVVFFQLNGAVLALYPQALQSADLKLARKPVPGGITLAVNLPDKKAVKTLLARAQTAGAKVIRPPHDAVWGGFTCYFGDPDGHPWEAAWNPFWKLDRKGNVRI